MSGSPTGDFDLRVLLGESEKKLLDEAASTLEGYGASSSQREARIQTWSLTASANQSARPGQTKIEDRGDPRLVFPGELTFGP